tara:strand:+ start:185 stop:331 length:147 start_codon:yes stop_codon:yes gene_type:complete
MIEILNMDWIKEMEYTWSDFNSVFFVYAIGVAACVAVAVYYNVEIEEW